MVSFPEIKAPQLFIYQQDVIKPQIKISYRLN